MAKINPGEIRGSGVYKKKTGRGLAVVRGNLVGTSHGD